MSGDSASGKICKICGQDCSGKPRTKDAKGFYYCKECHEQAARKVPPTAQPKPRKAISPADLLAGDDPGPLNLIDQLIPEPPPIMGGASGGAPGMGGGGPCPACGHFIPPGGALCTNCGFNTATGGRLAVKQVREKRDWSGTTGAMGWLINPGVAALVALALYGLAMALAMGHPNRADGGVVFSAWHLPFSLGVSIFVLVLAFRESVGTGFLTLCVPCYVLYFLTQCGNRWAQYLYVVNIIGTVVYIAMFSPAMQPGMHYSP